MLSEILQRTYFSNRILDYSIALAMFVGGILAIQIVKGITLHRLKAWAKKSATTMDDFIIRLVEKRLIPFLYFVALYLAVNSLNLPPLMNKGITVAVAAILTYFGIRLAVSLLHYALQTYWVNKEVDESRRKNLSGIVTVIKVLIWGVGITLLLDNLGFKISAIVAGLGIGGIAVALAAQTILGDLFSYFVIFFDRPFEIGDFIVVNEFMGSIEYIGIKSTRVRSLGGEQLVFSNTDLTNSRIRNFKRMEKRRIVFKIGVIYQTTFEQMKEIPLLIRNVIEDVPDTVFDRAHFSEFGDFSLNIEIVYYVLSGDYNKYMDTQQEINFRIMKEFEKQGIEFAYPTQTLFVEKTQGKES